MKKGLFVLVLLSFLVLLVSCNSDLGQSEDGPYTITFETNGGSTLTPMTVDEHDFFLPESIPTKDGFIFAGWYLDANFLYPMAFNAGTASSLTLYAKWVETSDLITVDEIETIVESIFSEMGYDMSQDELISFIEDLLAPDLHTSEEIEAIVSAILADNGYDMTRAELIEAIETTLGETMLSSSDVELIVDQIISEGGIVDEEALMTQILENINVVSAFENHITDMLFDVRQSVVMVDTYDGATLVSGGSGVIYKRVGNTYYVLTNEHVVYDYDNNNYYSNNEFAITIFTNAGEERILRSSSNIVLHGKSIAHDLAVLTFTSTKDFRVIDLGLHENLKVGQLVFAIGSPLDLPNSSSMGMISQIDREQADEYGMDTVTIQHTAPINPGNSGGALVNIYGELVGLNN
ncbi:MAG: trypsin-like serine protease, partial [Bacillota bacterium]